MLQLHLSSPSRGDSDSQELAGHLSVKGYSGRFECVQKAGLKDCLGFPSTRVYHKGGHTELHLRTATQHKLKQALLYIAVPSCTQRQPRSSFIALFCDTQVGLLQTFQFNELIALYYSPKHLWLTTGRDNIQLEILSDRVWQLLHSDLMKSCSEILRQLCMKMEQ